MDELPNKDKYLCSRLSRAFHVCVVLTVSVALFVFAVYEITVLAVPVALIIVVLAVSLSRCFHHLHQHMEKAFVEKELAWKMKQNIELSLHQEMTEMEEKLQEANRSKRAFLNVLEDFRHEKNEVEMVRNNLDAIVNGVADGIMVIDENGVITMANSVLAEWLHLDLVVLQGMPWHKYLDLVDELGQSSKELFAQFIDDPSCLQDPHFVSSLIVDGRERPLSISASKIEAGDKKTGTVLVLRDVESERKLSRAKNDFVSVASHQLRTPLTSINWQLESILGGDFGELTDELKEAIDMAYRSSQEMNALIVALLNVARVDMGYMRIRPESVDLIEVCRGILQEVSGVTKKKNLQVEYCADQISEMPLDKNLVKVIVENLITNAVRYTPDGGTIKVHLKVDGENAVVEVADNGIGIPESQQGKIFEKLFRADNVLITVPQGTGLGLYIAKAVVTEMGGSISFESKEGQGSTFWLSLPLKGAAAKDGRQSLISMCQII